MCGKSAAVNANSDSPPAAETISNSNMSQSIPVKRLAVFERYLTLWVFLCMVAGVGLGRLAPGLTASLSNLEFGQHSQVNVPIAVLIWVMIYPMMLKVDFTALGGIAKRPKGLAVTLFINWLVKPFSMALLAWLFMQHIFARWIDAETAKNYTAGLIILAAAPCTAMVFVWSYLTDGDPVYTLVQVAVNDLIMLFAFAPIVMFLCGVAKVVVPSKVLITSVVVFIVIPLAAGWLTRTMLLNWRGKDWFEKIFLAKFHPMTIAALLLTLVLIFAFQAENLTTRWLAVLLLAVPIVIQVYFNSTLAYLLMRWLRVSHNVAAPGALIGASNFFELAVAVAITLFGPGSGAALATVVGVLVEVPVMLSVCAACNRTRHWFAAADEGNETLLRQTKRRNNHMKKKVLFVCIHNSARSQMAGAFLNRICGDEFEAHSAGLEPGKLNPIAVAVMREASIDISGNQTKAVSDFVELGKTFAWVITVCDETSAERCPIFPGATTRLHWSFPDPARFQGTHEEKLARTREVRDMIEQKVRQWCDDVCSV
jgi:ACR3 family arsenite transporter